MSGTRASSTPDAVTARLAGWIEPIVVAAGLDLEELVVRPTGQRSVVRVLVDSERGVSLDEVADVSRALSDALDVEEGVLGSSPYVLEVSSRGVDRPLALPRHWRRNTGRLVVVDVVGGAPLTGRIAAVTDEGVTLAVQRGGGKGRVAKDAGERALIWAELGPGHVQIEFNRPAGHRDAHLVVGEADDDTTDDDTTDDDTTDDSIDEGPDDDVEVDQ